MKSNENIFISYSWRNKTIVDEIDNDFKRIGIKLIRDERYIGDFESISDFMKKIRDSNYVLMVISDEYLKSPSCMFEVLELKKERDYEKRILPILLEDAKQIFKLDGKQKYIKYWENEFDETKKKIGFIDLINSGKLIEQLRVIERIGRDISDFLFTLSDMKLRSLKELKEKNYKPILDFIGCKDTLMMTELIKINNMEDLEDKEIELDKFTKIFGETAEYYFIKGYMSQERDNNKKAKYFYEKVLEINPNFVEALTNIATLLTKNYEDYKGAKKYYERAIEINPNNADAHNNLANLLAEDYFKDYIGERKHYEKALEINPNDAMTHYNLASLLAEEYYKDYKEARKHYEKAIEIDPNYVKAHYNLAILLTEEYYKDYKGARKNYERALEIEPNHAKAHNNLANLLAEEYYKDYEGARKHYERALEIDSNNADAHNNLATLLVIVYKDYESARKHYIKSLEINPNDARIRENLANLGNLLQQLSNK